MSQVVQIFRITDAVLHLLFGSKNSFVMEEPDRGGLCCTVETEVNGDLKSTKGFLLAWFVGPVVPVQETFILPWLLWSVQNQKKISSPYAF